jgi:hypothetical protein
MGLRKQHGDFLEHGSTILIKLEKFVETIALNTLRIPQVVSSEK